MRFTFTNSSIHSCSTVDTFDLDGISNCLCHYFLPSSSSSSTVHVLFESRSLSTFNGLTILHNRNFDEIADAQFHLSYPSWLSSIYWPKSLPVTLCFIAVITNRVELFFCFCFFNETHLVRSVTANSNVSFICIGFLLYCLLDLIKRQRMKQNGQTRALKTIFT